MSLKNNILDGWNQVVLRLGNNKFDFQIWKYNSWASMYNSVYLLDTSGNLQSTDLFYFGCKSWTDTSVKYILSSIQFLSDSNANSCLSNPLLTLFYYSSKYLVSSHLSNLLEFRLFPMRGFKPRWKRNLRRRQFRQRRWLKQLLKNRKLLYLNPLWI